MEMKTNLSENGYSFGLLKVDEVPHAETGKIAKTPSAPWIQTLKAPFKTRLPQCTLFCSNTAINFNQIQVMDTYGTHLFLWRKTKLIQNVPTDVYLLRIFSGDKIGALVAAKKGAQQATSGQNVEEVGISVSTTPAEPHEASAEIDVTTVMVPYADACACDDLNVVRQTVKSVVDKLEAEIAALAAQQKEGSASE